MAMRRESKSKWNKDDESVVKDQSAPSWSGIAETALEHRHTSKSLPCPTLITLVSLSTFSTLVMHLWIILLHAWNEHKLDTPKRCGIQLIYGKWIQIPSDSEINNDTTLPPSYRKNIFLKTEPRTFVSRNFRGNLVKESASRSGVA